MTRNACAAAIAILICWFADSHATNYYLSPNGSDSNTGSSTATAWATLHKAESNGLQPGDTLFIMGGHYYDQQFLDAYPYISGTYGNPIVFKAYGDSIAVFQGSGNTSSDYSYRVFFMLYASQDYVTIDGFSHINPADSLYLKFITHESDDVYSLGTFRIDGCNGRHTGIEIKGCELTAYAPGMPYNAGGGYAITLQCSDSSLVRSNYMHHWGMATGDEQSGGEAVFLINSTFCTIERNTIKHCAHGSILLGEDRALSGPTKYIRVRNNFIENYWGGGIYILSNSSYNLLDGNVITHCGESTEYTKPAIAVSGPHNVVRRNVIYSPLNGPISIEAQWAYPQLWCLRPDSCLVYNNTIIRSARHYNLLVTIKNHLSGNGCDGASATGSMFCNNIFLKAAGTDPYEGTSGELTFDTYFADLDHNWLDPDDTSSKPASTHWGGNWFFNNCVYHNAEGAYYPQLVQFSRDSHLTNSCLYYSLTDVQSADPIAWKGNIAVDPKIVSEDPDSYGLAEGWWRIGDSSPCVDAGVVVNDYIGAFVKSLNARYGWSNLAYRGTRPDIGAYESDAANPIAPLSPKPVIGPGKR